MSRRISEIRAGVPPPATPTPRKIIPPPNSKSGTPHPSVFTPQAYERMKKAMERGELETPSRVSGLSPNDKRPFVIPMRALEVAKEEPEHAQDQVLLEQVKEEEQEEEMQDEEVQDEGREEKAV